jgi:ABC-type nickel/cobalt efflux system permease component RcnA
VPFTDQKVENGLIVTDVFTAYAIPVTNDAYVTVTFRKSPILASYNRTFQKIDDFFAYVGGLIGTVMGLFLIISSYN